MIEDTLRIIKRNKPWTDEEFPPKLNSLIRKERKSVDKEFKNFFAEIEWERASIVYPGLSMDD